MLDQGPPFGPSVASYVRSGVAIRHARNRDPIAFLQRRAEASAQRSADLDKLAKHGSHPQSRTEVAYSALAIFVLHDMSDAVERRRAQSEDED